MLFSKRMKKFASRTLINQGVFDKRNFCGGAVAAFVGGPDFFRFLTFYPFAEVDSKFILYRWKEGFFVGIYKKKGLGLMWA